MGTSNNKKKTLKSIKNKATAHPYSRKATQIRRALHRNVKIDVLNSKRSSTQLAIINKQIFFKHAIDPTLPCISKADLLELILMYLSRFDDEINRLTSLQRKDRKTDPKLASLLLVKSSEMEEFKSSGMEVVDLTDKQTVKMVHLWDGDFNFYKTLKLIRIFQE